MRRLTAILATIMIVLLSLVPTLGAYAAKDSSNRLYIVSENGLTVNLRSRPNGSFVAHLGVGKPVTKIGDSGNGWTRVSALVDGETVKGYVMNTFLSKDDPSEAPQTFKKVRRFVVTAAPSKGEDGHVNLRREPDANSTCLRYLHNGDKLKVLEESNAWYKVRTADKAEGYVVKAFTDKFAVKL